jgi:hypothetical protein
LNELESFKFFFDSKQPIDIRIRGRFNQWNGFCKSNGCGTVHSVETQGSCEIQTPHRVCKKNLSQKITVYWINTDGWNVFGDCYVNPELKKSLIPVQQSTELSAESTIGDFKINVNFCK